MKESDLHWAPQSWPLRLETNEVHVWHASLDVRSPRVTYICQTLSLDEQTRARRFYFNRDAERFIVARGLLRAILARYLGRQPDQLRFRYSSFGKPALATELGGDELCFNVSHSDGRALFAITRCRRIGVDLERLRPDFPIEQVAEKFFSTREVTALRSLPATLQPEAFFNCWTRKEAYIKARGEGLALRLDQFEVSLAPGEPVSLLRTDGDSEEKFRWSLQALVPWPGYAAALAVEGQDWQLKCWQWPEYHAL